MVTKSHFCEAGCDAVIKPYLCEHICSQIRQYNMIRHLGTNIMKYLPEISYRVCNAGQQHLEKPNKCNPSQMQKSYKMISLIDECIQNKRNTTQKKTTKKVSSIQTYR